MQRIPMTEIGAAKLREELQYRKVKKRREISEDLSRARAHGDLSENAEYDAAKEDQAHNEGRIQELENKLANAHVVTMEDLSVQSMTGQKKVVFAATVTLLNINKNETITYQIVGDDEADVKINKLSYKSPIARALIGKIEGDIIEVETPSGIVEFEIIKVEYI